MAEYTIDDLVKYEELFKKSSLGLMDKLGKGDLWLTDVKDLLYILKCKENPKIKIDQVMEGETVSSAFEKVTSALKGFQF